MKRTITKITILLVIFLSAGRASAQLASGIPHLFSVSATTPAAFPTVGNVNVLVPATTLDEWDTLLAPAGFNFNFAGVSYNKFVVSTNGWISLIPTSLVTTTIPASIPNAMPNNLLSNNTTTFPLIAPLWDDLADNVITYNYTAGVLMVRWNAKWQKLNAAYSPLFWVKLDQSNSTITFNYANNAGFIPTTPSASIGIAGKCTGDFYSVYTTANNAAYVDSVTENTNIGQGGATTIRPYNCSFTFTPYSSNDNCANAIDLGTISGTCTSTSGSTINATTSGSAICSTPDVKDVYFKFIKPAGAANVTITTTPATCSSVTGTTVELLSGCGGTSLACATTSTGTPNFGEIVTSRPCTAETLYVRVTADADAAGRFNICVKTGGGSSGQTCASATPICAPLPYNQTGMTTAGSLNDYDSTSSACHSVFMNGEDYLFTYTPVTNQCIRISINTTGQNPGIFIYSGCPNSPGIYCLGSAEAPTGTVAINSVSLVAGQTYYIVVDNSTAAGNTNIPFDISVTAVGTANAYDICASAVNLGTISNGVSCVPQTYSTECSTPTAVGQAGLPSCVPAHNPPYFIDGVTGDVWLRFTAGFSGSLQINTYQSASNPTSNAAMAIYTGATCPTTGAAPYACDYNSGPNGMPSLSIPVINGTTYYIRVWSENPENEGNFDICFQSACAPPNDLPCGAIQVPIGGVVAGFNTCASGTGEPANAAQCVTGGTINTVWFYTIVPASGQVRVRTHPLTLTDTQIQGYTFPSGGYCTTSATSNSPKACNDDGTACAGGYNDFSEQLFTGLTPTDTFWVAVDGVNSLTGSFEITFIDGNSTIFPPVLQQDCGNPQVICSTNDIVVADPGYRNNGNICDLPSGYGCWGTGERNSVWYQFTVDPALTGGTATLGFDVLTQASTDIDVIMWDVTGNANACAQIQSQTLPIAGCNYAAANASTGLTTTSPPPYAYSPAITFTGAPRTYLLLLNNWNSSANAGYTLHWAGTPPPISNTASSSVWNGQTDTYYATTTNWGACGTRPTCGIDATINPTANGRQPIIIGTESVKNITINAGATLTIQTGATLSVCGNFTNLGTLICQPGSTVNFIGTANQTISGNLNSPNSFANLVINKLGGSVQLLNNIEAKENFTISNATSVFNFNGKYFKLGGNYTGYNNATTTSISGSTLEFNGTTNQIYTNTNTQDSLYNVIVNKASGTVNLSGVNGNLNIENVLTLTLGNIITTPTLEVNVKLGTVGAILTPSPNSYVQGRLRRKLFLGSIDFPVGDPLVPNAGAQKGYELANVTFTSSTVVPDLLAWFNLWPGATPNGPAGFDFCGTYTTQWDLLPILDNGYWSFSRSASSYNGAYNLTLYNTGGTNASGTNWSIGYAPIASNPSLQASWGLLGTCVGTSTMAIDKRNQFNVPALALGASSFNHLYAAVQSTVVLPVELLSFTAEPRGEEVICRWETASEMNNDYFEVQRSSNGTEFETLGSVRGYGMGTSTSNREYSFIDPQMCRDIRYYRLKQVDIDGKYSFSETVAVDCRKKTELEVFPNPAKNTITYQFDQDQNSKLKISIVDITGRQVYTELIDGMKGVNQITTNISQLAAGVYYLRISKADNNGDMLQTQFFKN